MFGYFLFLSSACSKTRVSGIYIEHSQNFVNMLQLTQANDGRITGVFTGLELKNGELEPETMSITGGTLDGEQLTLTLNPGVLGGNISGTFKGGTIRLQSMASNGAVMSSTLERGHQKHSSVM
jgi:hypothetical protein